MTNAIRPLFRQSLTDDLAQRVTQLIRGRSMQIGDRLPSITEMARHFKVGAPTVREALKSLEAVGVISIRHGSGVYVSRSDDSLVISNRLSDAAVSKKLLLDLIEARIPIEMKSAALAAEHATSEHLTEMRALLDASEREMNNDEALNRTNMAFHRQIAVASGNAVIRQLLEVLTGLFMREQRAILDIQDSRAEDHAEHVGIYDAMKQHDVHLAATRMQQHLDGVRNDLDQWNPTHHPID